jgi:hypothetical protein
LHEAAPAVLTTLNPFASNAGSVTPPAPALPLEPALAPLLSPALPPWLAPAPGAPLIETETPATPALFSAPAPSAPLRPLAPASLALE